MKKDKDDIPELNPKRKPWVSIPVRTGTGKGFLKIRLWKGDPDTEKRFRQESAVRIVEKKRKEGEIVNGEDLYLTPS